MGSHSAGRHGRGATSGSRRYPVGQAEVPARDRTAATHPSHVSEREPYREPTPHREPSPYSQRRSEEFPRTSQAQSRQQSAGPARSTWVTSEWSSGPSAGTAPLPRRSPPPRPTSRPPGELDTLTGPLSRSSRPSAGSARPAPRPTPPSASRSAGRVTGEIDTLTGPLSMSSGSARPARPGRASLFDPVRPVGSLDVPDVEADAPASDRPRNTRAAGAASENRRQGGTRPGSTSGRGAHRAPAPRRAPGRTRMVVAGTASLAGLSAIVTGVALTGEHPVTSAGPTTGATPLIQVDEARHAFGSADAQASRGSRDALPPQVSSPTEDLAGTGSGTSTGSGAIVGREYGYQRYTRPDSPTTPANPGTAGDEGLNGYEIPFVPLTPQTSAAPADGTTPPAGTASAPGTGGTATGGTATGGTTTGGTTTGGATTAPGTSQPGGTATPNPTTPTKPATKPSAGGSTTPATPRPSGTATTPRPSTTPQEGELPFNPEPVEVTPIWDVLFPPQSSTTTSGTSTSTTATASSGSTR